jgi:WD40 repeat protein
MQRGDSFHGYNSESPLTAAHVALSVVDSAQGRIISCGYWDNALRVHALDSLREVAVSFSGHIGGITCVQLDKQGGNILVTGGADGTCRVWLLERPSLLSSFFDDLKPKGVTESHWDPNLMCVHTLCGHEAPITALHYSTDLDLVLSGSQDGTLCLHSARRGEFIRMITRLRGVSVDVLMVCGHGYLIAHSWSALKTWVFWVNGQELSVKSSALSSSLDDIAKERYYLFIFAMLWYTNYFT